MISVTKIFSQSLVNMSNTFLYIADIMVVYGAYYKNFKKETR